MKVSYEWKDISGLPNVGRLSFDRDRKLVWLETEGKHNGEVVVTSVKVERTAFSGELLRVMKARQAARIRYAAPSVLTCSWSDEAAVARLVFDDERGTLYLETERPVQTGWIHTLVEVTRVQFVEGLLAMGGVL